MKATLTEQSFREGVSALGDRDPDLASVLERWGSPPFWVHPPGFPGLVLAILSQQVSIESADAAFSKLKASLVTLTPQAFLTLNDSTLREVGFSRQKASYVRQLALQLAAGEFRLEDLETLVDADAHRELQGLYGVGDWTAATYLLFALQRADAWPRGDLALAKAIQEVKRLERMPDWDAVDHIAEAWRPLRAVAARILWHHYLCLRGRG
jgi:DNA-3-methyladenine glycosylase II